MNSLNLFNLHIMAQKTGLSRHNSKEQYYTTPNLAKTCIDLILHTCPETQQWLWIEPVAGDGVFIQQTPCQIKTIGIDIDPKTTNLIKSNFLTWTPTPDSYQTEQRILLFGNPPFGRQSTTAKQFVRHSIQFAEMIAFILPRSFLKPSMSRVFPLNYHCVLTHELDT